MRKRMSRALLGLLVLALVIGPAVAQAQQGGDLKGKVIDKGGKFPLPTVRVSVVGTRKSAPTNSEGGTPRIFWRTLPAFVSSPLLIRFLKH